MLQIEHSFTRILCNVLTIGACMHIQDLNFAPDWQIKPVTTKVMPCLCGPRYSQILLWCGNDDVIIINKATKIMTKING